MGVGQRSDWGCNCGADLLYGTEYGTWIDEAGSLSVEPPTFILPFAIGGLGFVLLIGGVIAGSKGMPSAASSGREARR